jgi:uncharacterized protein (UPF0333 family)
MMLKNRRGQSTLEYIILVAAVVVALLAFLPGTFSTAFNNTIATSANSMEDMANRISTSRPLAPTP